jgi:hypothetical protein
MEECGDVEEWIGTRTKGKDSWVNMIVDQTTGMRYRWRKEHRKFEEKVVTAEKEGYFWYAMWGIYTIVAAREGTEAAARMRKMVESMKTKESINIEKGKGRLWVETEEIMEKVWGCEFTNMMIIRNASTQEEVDRIMINTREENENEYYRKAKRYAILVNIVDGCVVPPDELEHRRREEEDGMRGMNREWKFWRWEEWVLASRDEWVRGKWNAADVMISAMRFTYIGPRTDEYGEGEEYGNEEGMKIINHLADREGLSTEIEGGKKEEWTLNEVIKITGTGEDPSNGTFLGDVRMRVKGVWREEVKDRINQLKEGTSIELKMYRILGGKQRRGNEVIKENIDMDFNEERGDIMARTAPDRAGGRGMELGRLETLLKKGELVIGNRQEGKVVKIKINTTALRDMWDQINKKCEDWAGSVHMWGVRGHEIDQEQTEEDVNQMNEDIVFQAKAAMIYGFMEESTKKMKKGSLVEIVLGMARMGLRGDVNCKRPDLEGRVERNEYKITTGNVGINGGRDAGFGVMVEYFSSIRVGITGGVGLMIYEWRLYEHEGEKMKLTRQFLSEEETEMVKRSTMRKQDYLVVAARGMINKGTLDDVLRRSFKAYLEGELRIRVYVWVMQLRHMDERGRIRDEGIMIGLVEEGSGERMARLIDALKNGRKCGMMLVDGIDLQLFRDVKEIWNKTKPTTIGRAEKTIEVIAPLGCSNSTILRVLEEGGVSAVNMVARMRQPMNKKDESWMVVPKYGEKVKHRQVIWEGNTYVLVETERNKESERVEGCTVSYVMGVKRVETANEVARATGIASSSSSTSGSQISMSSLSMATTNSTGITEHRGNEDMENRLKRELEMMEGRSREMIEIE